MNTSRREWFSLAGIALGGVMLSTCNGPARATAPLAVIATNRAGFGPRPSDLEGFDFEEFLEGQLHPDELDDDDCDRRLQSLVTLRKSFDQLYSDHWHDIPDDYTDEEWAYLELPYHQTVQGAFLRAVYSRRQLQEVLADFWHNHFSVYGRNEEIMPLFPAYDRDAIRPHVLGSFRAMLGAVAAHPVMSIYLDNRSNELSGPNQNYARELLELHTLGADSYQGARDPLRVERGGNGVALAYVENDVSEVARCFTGFAVDEEDGRFGFSPSWHDPANKLVLGRYLPRAADDVSIVLDMLAEHPATARHIAFKLCRRLVADDPPPELVARAARVFHQKRHERDQLRHVVRLILSSVEFKTTWGSKRKRPFEFTVSLLRALNADFSELSPDFLSLYERMGQPLFARTSPDGYPDVAGHWDHTGSILFRWQLIHDLLAGELEVRVDLEPGDWSWRLLGRLSRHQELLDDLRSPRELVSLLAMGAEFQMR